MITRKSPIAVALLAISSYLTAVSAVAQADGEPTAKLEEIVVTALRRDQNLQDVPATVSAITASDVSDYNLFRFDDIEALTPGLAADGNGAFGSRVQLRGVGFDTNASASPAVDIYINEAPVDANYALQSIFDIGQVEILRGPQGVLRGRPAPGGAITLTSRRPDLEGTGGYVSGSAGNNGTTNLQGAINIPVIDNQLAVRLAAVSDKDEGNGIKSLTSNHKDDRDTEAWRASVRWIPTDAIDVNLNHHSLDIDYTSLLQVEGDGAGYNQGPISGADRLSVQEGPRGGNQQFEMTNLQVSLDLPSHRLVFNGAWQDNSYLAEADLDVGNAVTNFAQTQRVQSQFKVDTYELRLESATEGAMVDYSIGLWYSNTDTDTVVRQPAAPLDGAFGNPLAPSPIGPINDAYMLYYNGHFTTQAKNKAIFGNVDIHLSDRTDLSLAARYLSDKAGGTNTDSFDPALNAVGIAPGVPLDFVPNVSCDILSLFADPAFTGNEPFPGYCDYALNIPASSSDRAADSNEWVYSASLKHEFSDELIAYFSYGHSFRPAGVTVAVPVADPYLIQGNPEESDSFELGVRSSQLGGRLTLSASIYHQQFDNFIGRFNDIPFVNAGTGAVESGAFTYPADAIVDGIDAEMSFEITSNWSLDARIAYTDGHFDNQNVPCHDTDMDGSPDNGDIGNLAPADFAGDSVMYCSVDSKISTIPDFTSSINTEFDFKLFGQNAFVRGLWSYYGKQDNLGGPYEADAYNIVNLYAGLRGANDDWEVSFWARNLFDEDNKLTQNSPQSLYGRYNGNFGEVSYVREREFGISVRYIFGDG